MLWKMILGCYKGSTSAVCFELVEFLQVLGQEGGGGRMCSRLLYQSRKVISFTQSNMGMLVRKDKW